MALAHKGIEPVTVPWRFHERDLLPGAPANRQVPVIVDGEQIVAGSTAIAYHLEERHPNSPSLFGGAGGEAHARFILAWTDSVLIPGLFPIAAAAILPLLDPEDRDYFRTTREKRLGMSLEQSAAARPANIAAIQHSLDPLRRTFADQPFLGGDEPSYADYAVFGSFQWLRCVGAPDVLGADDLVGIWLDVMLDLFDGLGRSARVAATQAA